MAACEAAVARTLAEHGRLDVLWANAGITSYGLLLRAPAAWRRTVEINLLGAYNTVRAGLPAVIERRLDRKRFQLVDDRITEASAVGGLARGTHVRTRYADYEYDWEVAT